MKDLIEIYKEVQNSNKNKIEVDKIKDMKKHLLENIEKDSQKNEPVQYDRDKFLYYKVMNNSYDINYVAIILSAVSIMVSVGAIFISANNNGGDLYFGIFILAIILASVSICLVLKKGLISKAGIAKVISVILDEIDREIWQGKDN